MDVGARMARGAVWMVASRVIDRGIGLVSTLVLVRLLVPGDFGLVSMAMSILSILGLLSAFSFDTALIQNQRAERRHYDTAWTIGVIFGCVNALMLVILAIPVSKFYREPRLEAVLYCLAVSSAIGGFANVGTVAFRKDLQLNKEFNFQVAKRLIMVAMTIALAILFRSYWALVVAAVLSGFVGVVISYFVHPFRPRFSLAGWHDLFHISKWLLVTNLLNFLHHRSVDFVIGKISGAGSLGLYNIAYEISNLPTTDLVAPITRATFPGYAQMSAERAALRKMFVNVSAVVALITVPAGIGIAATSDLIVNLALGPNWVEASPLIALLAIYGVLQALQSNSGAILLALGKVRTLASVMAVYVAVLVPALVWGAHVGGSRGVAIATLVVGIGMTPINLALVFRGIALPPMEFLNAIWRPLVAASFMYAGVDFAQRLWHTDTVIERAQMALVTVTLGAIVYAVVVLILWRISSCPDGAEEYVLRKLRLEKTLQALKMKRE